MSRLAVLIVDENSALHGAVSSCIESFGFTVHTAKSCKEAVDTCADNEYACIFMNTGPLAGGFDCSKELRQGELQRHSVRTPIIALTPVHSDESFMTQYNQADMDDCLADPFEPEELRKILLRHTYSADEPNLRLLPNYKRDAKGP